MNEEPTTIHEAQEHPAYMLAHLNDLHGVWPTTGEIRGKGWAWLKDLHRGLHVAAQSIGAPKK